MVKAAVPLEEIALTAQNHYERTSTVPTPPKTDEDAIVSHLCREERPKSPELIPPEVV